MTSARPAIARIGSWTGFPSRIPHVARGSAIRARRVQLPDRREVGQAGRDHLGSAGEAGEEVRLDEPEGDPRVGVEEAPVDPRLDLRARHRPDGGVRVLVVRVVLDDLARGEDVLPEHPGELVGGARAVGPRRHDEPDAAAGQLREEDGQDRPRRERPRDVADAHRDEGAGRDQVGERRPEGRVAERAADGLRRIGERDGMRRPEDVDAVRDLDLEALAAEREPDPGGVRHGRARVGRPAWRSSVNRDIRAPPGVERAARPESTRPSPAGRRGASWPHASRRDDPQGAQGPPP